MLKCRAKYMQLILFIYYASETLFMFRKICLLWNCSTKFNIRGNQLLQGFWLHDAEWFLRWTGKFAIRPWNGEWCYWSLQCTPRPFWYQTSDGSNWRPYLGWSSLLLVGWCFLTASSWLQCPYKCHLIQNMPSFEFWLSLLGAALLLHTIWSPSWAWTRPAAEFKLMLRKSHIVNQGPMNFHSYFLQYFQEKCLPRTPLVVPNALAQGVHCEKTEVWCLNRLQMLDANLVFVF